MKDNLKVLTASIVGFAAPATNWLFDALEPVLRLLVLVGQIGVAGVTILYIVQKWRNVRDKRK